MRRAIFAIALVVLFAGSAVALTGGPGGYVYWSRPVTDSNSAAWTNFMLYRSTVDTDWSHLGTTQFDNVPFDSRGYNSFGRGFMHSLEVLDPRKDGGGGNLLQVSIYDQIPYDATSYNQPWDIVKVNPAGGQSLITTGKKSPGWETVHMGVAIPAPQNWVGTSNGLSLLTADGIWGTEFQALYDTNNNGVIDNDATEGQDVYDSGTYDEWKDIEIASDGVIYWSEDDVGGPNIGGVLRTWLNASGAGTTQVYYTPGPTKLCREDTDGAGVAVGPVKSNPIVYFGGLDNVELVTGGYDTQAAIFALVDLNDDNDADDPGEEFKLWRDNDFGINVQDDLYGVEDIEFYQDSAGKQFLLFSSYNNVLGVLELADNGLAAIDGTTIATNVTRIGGYSAGFEIDMNPGEVIPEPATMLLLGTGALGVIGFIRRRRMK